MPVVDSILLEVVAPAGSMEHVRAAIAAGADAIYIGIKGMSARPDPWGFDFSNASEVTRIVHAAGKRVYFALNAGHAESHTSEIVGFLNRVEDSGCDALIVGDWGVLKRIQDMAIQVPLHASSLLGVYNIATVHLLRRMGVSRVILNTNLFLDEIAALIRACPDMEFEIITYGGICFNDQRRCRLPHVVVNGHYHVGCEFGYLARDQRGYGHQRNVILHMPDVDLASTLTLYVALGITSFKIEGRTRSTNYVTQSTSILRQAIDKYLEGSQKANISHYVIHPADTGI